MKRDDIAIAHAAIDMALGSLSPDEEALIAPALCPFNTEDPVTVEGLLYYHLDIARRMRLTLDRAPTWNHTYQLTHARREQAVADAEVHLRKLIELGHPIDDFLQRHIAAEGLKP